MSDPTRLIDEAGPNASALERDLLRAGRPTLAARERDEVWLGLSSQLAAPAAPVGKGPVVVAKLAAGAKAAAVVKGAIVVAALGGGAVVGVRALGHDAPATIVAPAPRAVSSPPAPSPEPPAPSLPVIAPREQRPRPMALVADPSSHRLVASRLAAEGRVVLDARQALRDGQPVEALRRLEAARVEFGDGALAQEREALTVEALARAGRRDEAHARRRSCARTPRARTRRPSGLLRRLSIWRAALPILTLAACAPRDGQVGAAPPLDGATAPDASVLFMSELAANAGAWDEVTPLEGARVTFGAANASAVDGLVAELRFPGDATLGAADRTDPNLATMIETRQYFRYGTFVSHVQFPTCAPTEEIASAAFMYFSDGGDDNGNGIVDEQELDFHVLCGTPSFIVLTAWSDYEAHGGVETFRKSSRAVDTATGDLWDNVAPDDATYAKTGNDATLVQLGFPAPDTFYEVGIDWQATRVRFFIVVGGAEVTLWTLTDPTFVPQVPLPLMFNLWHPPTHWLPARTPAGYPAHDGVMRVDWARFTSP